MHIGPQPAEQRRHVPFRQRGIQARFRRPRRLHQLRRRHGAEGVGGEVAEGAIVPVDVLQAALGVVGGRDAEHPVQRLVPRARQVHDLEIPRDQGAFQPEAQDDMGGVGDLVGVHADEAAFHPPPLPGEVRGGIGFRRPAEGRAQLAAEEGQEGIRPAGLHLDDQGLGFMRRHAGGLAHRLPRPAGRQPALVQRVPRLVQHAEQRLGHVVLVVEGRQPHIRRRAAAEGVQRFVEPRVVVVEPDPLRQPAAQAALDLRRERPRQRDGGRLRGLDRLGARQGLGQEGLIGGEDGFHIRRRHAALVAIHQRVIGVHAEFGGQRPRGFALQAHHLGQGRAHQGEVGTGLGLPPDLLAGRIGARGGFHEVRRQGGGAGMGAFHQRKVGLFPSALGARDLEILLDLRSNQQFMREPGQGGELLPARCGPAGRHHGRGIPVQYGGRFPQRSDAREAGLQAVIGGVVHGASQSFSRRRAQTRKTPTRAAARPYQVMA